MTRFIDTGIEAPVLSVAKQIFVKIEVVPFVAVFVPSQDTELSQKPVLAQTEREAFWEQK